MSNVGRIITLVIEIQTSEYPKWIMDAHMKQAEGGANDVKVRSISEGNVVDKLDKLTAAVAEEVDYDYHPTVADAMDLD